MSFETLQFGECANLVRASTSPSLFGDSPYIALEHIDQGSLSLNGHAFGRDAESQKTAFQKGDILFGKLRPYFRKAVIAPFDGICSTDIWVVRPANGTDRNFLFYWMASENFVNHATDTSEGTRMPRAKWDIVAKMEIPYLGISEQIELGLSLRALDNRITLLRETNATLEAIAQALFKSWFVDFDPVRAKLEGRAPEGMDEATTALFPDGFEESELGLVPRGWRVLPIGEVCTLGRGSSPRPIQNFMGDDIPWIKIADATASDGMFVFKTKEKIRKEGAAKSMRVGHGDLIMSNSASCGIPVFVELEGCIHDGWLYFKNFSEVSKNLLFYWLRHISAHLVHIADGSVQKNLNIGLVSSQPIICPSPKVLAGFDDLSQPLLDRIRENCLQAQTLATLRDTLLPRLISGQLRLPEAEAQVEEATV